MNSINLLSVLIKNTQLNIQEVKQLETIDLEILNWKKSKDEWSVLECLEHLNLYSEYYHIEIENRISKSKTQFNLEFKSGILGGYFSKMMQSKKGMKKMKTSIDKNPVGQLLTKEVLTQFIKHQENLISLLIQSEKVDLNKTKTSISISKWIKLKLGDTLQFLVAHNQRHLIQAKQVLENYNLSVNT